MILARLRAMLGRDPGERERKARQLAAAEVKQDATLERAKRVLEERDRIRAATRGVVTAVQRAGRR